MPAFEVESRAEPDREAIADEVTRLLRADELTGHLVLALALRWRDDRQLKRLLAAALRTLGLVREAEKIDRTQLRRIAAQKRRLPPTPFITRATELPDEIDGLTATQRTVLEAVRVAAPHGGPFVRIAVIAAEVALKHKDLTEDELEHAVISLGHPALRRLPLVELQGLTGLFTPNDTHCTHARLTREGLEVLEDSFPLPLLLVNGAEGADACIPPHAPKELAVACQFVLRNPNCTVPAITRHLEGPDFPGGGVALRTHLQNYCWSSGPSELTLRGILRLEIDPQGQARMVIGQLPWPLTGRTVKEAVEALRLDGVSAVFDHSSATEQRVVVELEHLAFSGQVRDAICKSCVSELTFAAALEVDAPSPRRLDLADLLEAFLVHRRKVAVTRLEQAVARAQARAQAAEAVCLALLLLDPVLAVLRAAVEDDEAVQGLMNFMRPEYRDALSQLPFPPSHDYAKGFTEAQAKHLLTVRKLPARQREFAERDWAALRAEVASASERLRDRNTVLELMLEELRAAAARFDEPRRTSIAYV